MLCQHHHAYATTHETTGLTTQMMLLACWQGEGQARDLPQPLLLLADSLPSAAHPALSVLIYICNWRPCPYLITEKFNMVCLSHITEVGLEHNLQGIMFCQYCFAFTAVHCK